MNVFINGFAGLCNSRKGALCLLILFLSVLALFLGKLTGLNFACIVGTIATIYNISHAYQQANVNQSVVQQVVEQVPAIVSSVRQSINGDANQ